MMPATWEPSTIRHMGWATPHSPQQQLQQCSQLSEAFKALNSPCVSPAHVGCFHHSRSPAHTRLGAGLPAVIHQEAPPKEVPQLKTRCSPCTCLQINSKQHETRPWTHIAPSCLMCSIKHHSKNNVALKKLLVFAWRCPYKVISPQHGHNATSSSITPGYFQTSPAKHITLPLRMLSPTSLGIFRRSPPSCGTLGGAS